MPGQHCLSVFLPPFIPPSPCGCNMAARAPDTVSSPKCISSKSKLGEAESLSAYVLFLFPRRKIITSSPRQLPLLTHRRELGHTPTPGPWPKGEEDCRDWLRQHGPLRPMLSKLASSTWATVATIWRSAIGKWPWRSKLVYCHQFPKKDPAECRGKVFFKHRHTQRPDLFWHWSVQKTQSLILYHKCYPGIQEIKRKRFKGFVVFWMFL